MILKKEDIDYLQELSIKWDLQYREPITIGTYRWYLFMYTNLYNCSPGYQLTEKDREILMKIFRKLQPEHKLTWVRHKIYEYTGDILDLRIWVERDIASETTIIKELQIALYLTYCIEIKDYILDDYIIDTFKFLEKYRR
jgi:hypothetical protein